MRDDLSTDLEGAAYLAREDGYDERPDPSEYMDTPEPQDFGGSAWCEECGAAVGEESLTNGHCWSCGERV